MVDARTITISARDATVALVDDYLAGRRALTGLDLYYELERVTPLLEFHRMMRAGERNRAHNGLQQSYGDHNRLLMLGLDRLLAGDVDWYRARLDGSGDLSVDVLRSCLDRASALDPPRDVLLALWLAAAMHDCGMLCGHGAYVDVEDGIVLSRDVIEALCPAPLRALSTCVLRHHDYIKGVFLGEVPASIVADDVEALTPALRPIAMAGLGLVQVAGAASLGEGRLGAFRVGIFDRCLAGDALGDRGVLTRVARLLSATAQVAPPATDTASRALDALPTGSADAVVRLAERTPVHAWQRVTRSMGVEARASLLVEIADRWRGSGTDHVVLAESATRRADRPNPPVRVSTDTALSGARLLLVEC